MGRAHCQLCVPPGSLLGGLAGWVTAQLALAWVVSEVAPGGGRSGTPADVSAVLPAEPDGTAVVQRLCWSSV